MKFNNPISFENIILQSIMHRYDIDDFFNAMENMPRVRYPSNTKNEYIFVIIGLGGFGWNIASVLYTYFHTIVKKIYIVDNDDLEVHNTLRMFDLTRFTNQRIQKQKYKKVDAFYACIPYTPYIFDMTYDRFIEEFGRDIYYSDNVIWIETADVDVTRKMIENKNIKRFFSFGFDAKTHDVSCVIYDDIYDVSKIIANKFQVSNYNDKYNPDIFLYNTVSIAFAFAKLLLQGKRNLDNLIKNNDIIKVRSDLVYTPSTSSYYIEKLQKQGRVKHAPRFYGESEIYPMIHEFKVIKP